ncbi:MAG: outer membrane beta-barrel protein [Bacteroidota bacterium]
MKRSILLLLFLATQFAMAQEQEEVDPCVQNIEIAQQRYDEGRIQDIQPLLNDCLAGDSYDKAQKAQALRLLTLSYIFLEDDDKAEATMLELITKNHEFRTNPAIDPTEFINLHERFRYLPVFNVGIKYIVSFSNPIVTDLNSYLSLYDDTPVYDLSFNFFSLGANFEWEFYDNMFLYPELMYRKVVFSRLETNKGIVRGSIDYLRAESYEEQNYISLPVSVKYVFDFASTQDFKLYTNLGVAMDYLASSKRPANKNQLLVEDAATVTYASTTTSDNKRLGFGVFAGGGATYKLGEGFLALELRYLHSFTQPTIVDNIMQPADPRLMNTMTQPDIYYPNNFVISLGYTKNIYLPKQLR